MVDQVTPHHKNPNDAKNTLNRQNDLWQRSFRKNKSTSPTHLYPEKQRKATSKYSEYIHYTGRS